MKREDLLAKGFSEEQITKILEMHKKELEGFVPLTRLNEKINEVKELTNDLKERDTQLESLRTNAGDVDTLKAEITKLTEANKNKEVEYAKNLLEIRKTTAIKENLLGANVQCVDTVSKLLNKDAILEVAGKEGEFLGLKEQIEGLKVSSPYLFKTTQENTPPQGSVISTFIKPAGGAGKEGGTTVVDPKIEAINFAKEFAQDKLRSLGLDTNKN